MEEIGIQTDSLQEILSGRNMIEGRLATERFAKFRVGDEISIREDVYEHGRIVTSRSNMAVIVITKIDRFDSFRNALWDLGFQHFRPADKTIERAVESYARYYSAADERQHGVVALTFRRRQWGNCRPEAGQHDSAYS